MKWPVKLSAGGGASYVQNQYEGKYQRRGPLRRQPSQMWRPFVASARTEGLALIQCAGNFQHHQGVCDDSLAGCSAICGVGVGGGATPVRIQHKGIAKSPKYEDCAAGELILTFDKKYLSESFVITTVASGLLRRTFLHTLPASNSKS